MKGLALITDQIIGEAKQNEAEILAQAEERVRALFSEAEEEMKRYAAEMRADTEKSLEEMRRRSESEKKRTERQMLLRVKSDAVDEVLREAKEKIRSLSDTEYRALMLRVFREYAEDRDYELVTSAAERKRLGEEFAEDCAKSMQKGSVVYAADCLDQGEGFVLRAGRVEENCTIDGIFAGREQEIRDVAAACLETRER